MHQPPGAAGSMPRPQSRASVRQGTMHHPPGAGAIRRASFGGAGRRRTGARPHRSAYDRVMLHCPATLFVARHGDAAYAGPHVMSDDGGWLTPTGREQVLECADRLRPERIARVFGSPMTRAEESAELASVRLDVTHGILDGLHEIRVGDFVGRAWSDPEMHAIHDRWVAGDLSVRVPGGESGEEVVHRFRDALQTIADQHRGEQVLVFTHGAVMSLVIPRLAHNVRDDLAHKQFLPNAVPARLEIGDGGWRVPSWPGAADRGVV